MPSPLMPIRIGGSELVSIYAMGSISQVVAAMSDAVAHVL